MIAFAAAWSDSPIRQQAVGELPWTHNLGLVTKLKQEEQRLAYARAALEDSPTIGLLLRKGKNMVLDQYILRDTNKPMGVAEHQPSSRRPRNWRRVCRASNSLSGSCERSTNDY